MTFITREQLCNTNKRRYLDVDLTDGKTCRIRSLMEDEKAGFETSLLNKNGNTVKARLRESRRRMICLCMVDENNDVLFRVDEFEALSKVDGLVLQTIYNACMKHCGFSEEDIADLVGNSEGTPEDASPSD